MWSERHLRPRGRAAVACYLAVAAGASALGLVYLVMPRFMPYHAAVAGLAWDEVPPRLRLLLGALQRGAGASGLAAGLAVGVMAWFGLRAGARWARVAIPLVALVGLVPMLLVTVHLRLETGVATPWPAAACGLGLVLVGAVLARR
jgi:hypothetical protein